jgi:amidase
VSGARQSLLVDWSARDLSAAIRRREISCVEVVRAHLDRVDALDDAYHALISRRPRDDVLADAAERDAELDRGLWRGWMHGLPHAVKDLAAVGGLPTTSGFRAPSDAPVAEHDDPFVARIRECGAVFIGKTNTPEFGLGSHTYNALGPTTGNVVDPTMSAGGSSGGAAVAVASGMVPVADGSDFMGSLRNPPGWNGVLGLRPSPGIVLGFGEDPASPGLSVEGPIARSVNDLSALLETMAEAGTFAVSEVPGVTWPPRAAWLGDLDGYLPFEDGVLETCRDGLQRWSPTVDVVLLPAVGTYAGTSQLWPTWLTLRHLEVGSWLASEFTDDEVARMKPEAQWELEGFRSLGKRQLDYARQVQHDLRRSVLSVLDEFDLLALPTAQCWPFPAFQHWPLSVAGVPMDTYHRWMEVTTVATLAGCPALAVPAGVNEAGLHMGLQLIGRPGGDAKLLAWAGEAERREAFAVTPPSVASGH